MSGSRNIGSHEVCVGAGNAAAVYLGLRQEGSAGAGVDEESKTCMGVKQKESISGCGGPIACFLTIHMDVDISWR